MSQRLESIGEELAPRLGRVNGETLDAQHKHVACGVGDLLATISDPS